MSSTFTLWTNVAGATVRLWAKAFSDDAFASSVGAYDERYTDGAGHTSFMFVPPGPVVAYVTALGYRPLEFATVMPDDGAKPITLERLPLARLVRIDRSQHRLVDEDGESVFGRGASAFLLYKAFLDGDRARVDAVLAQLEDLGCNLIRVMGMFESLGGFNPKAYPDYYDKIPAFCALCAEYGLYVLWTACAATGSVFPLADDAFAHLHRTVERLLTTRNALFSPVNEQGQHNNSIDRDRFKREFIDTGKLGWLVYDTGSFGGDLPVEPPFGLYAPFHVRRDYPSSVKDCGTIDHTNRVNDGLEIAIDEPYRMGDEGSGDRHTDPIVAREAAGIAYNALYFVAHSMQGERADVLTGNTLDCVAAAMDAMKGH